MPDLEEFLHTAQTEKLSPLMNEPETQTLFAMLRRSTGGKLEQAADQAAQGDTAPLVQAIRQLMRDPEAARLMDAMKQKLK